MGRGLHEAKAPVRTHPGVNAARLRAATGPDSSLDPGLGSDAGHGALAHDAPPGWRTPLSLRRTRGPRGLPRSPVPEAAVPGVQPQVDEILSIAARCRIAAMIFSSPAPHVDVEHSLEQPRPADVAETQGRRKS